MFMNLDYTPPLSGGLYNLRLRIALKRGLNPFHARPLALRRARIRNPLISCNQSGPLGGTLVGEGTQGSTDDVQYLSHNWIGAGRRPPNLAELEVAKRNQASKKGSRRERDYTESTWERHHD